MTGINRSADTKREAHAYDDIVALPHPVSQRHPQMPIADRAAQFSPFAALTGHDAAIKETARLTDRQIELDENSKSFLDEKLRMVLERLADHPQVTVTYFQPDGKKAGGAYVRSTGEIKKIDEYERLIVLLSGVKIPIDSIIALESELFRAIDDSGI